jgi:hypothetical protein
LILHLIFFFFVFVFLFLANKFWNKSNLIVHWYYEVSLTVNGTYVWERGNTPIDENRKQEGEAAFPPGRKLYTDFGIRGNYMLKRFFPLWGPMGGILSWARFFSRGKTIYAGGKPMVQHRYLHVHVLYCSKDDCLILSFSLYNIWIDFFVCLFVCLFGF